MSKIRRLISSVTGRFLKGSAEDYAPGETVQTSQRRGSYLTAGDRQKLSSALAVTGRVRQDLGQTNPSHLERAVLDLLTKTE